MSLYTLLAGDGNRRVGRNTRETGPLLYKALAPSPRICIRAKSIIAVTPETPAVTPETPAVTPETPAVTPETPAVTPETPAVTPETPAVTPETPAVTPETPAVTPETPAVTPETPAVTPETPAVTPEREKVPSGLQARNCSFANLNNHSPPLNANSVRQGPCWSIPEG
ncbi:hypothetical protein ACXR0O_01830 [Verrucomicrobiota bacterium sgz303538]